MGVSWTKKPLRRTLKSVYDDIDNAIDNFASTISNNSITNAKLATDIKVGSLASLTTTEKLSVVGAVNEIDSNVDSNTSAISAKYTKPGSGIPSTDMTSAVQASLALADSALQTVSFDSATPLNSVAATGTLTLTDVALDAQTVTIGTDVYEFCADTAQTVTGSNIAVDITSYTTKSTGTLTMATQPTSGDTVTIGSKTYTFVPDGTENAEGEVSIGANVGEAQVNLVAAINGTDEISTANTSASAGDFAANASTITALVGGVAGDSIATTETFTDGSDSFGAATLGSGADCSAANAVTALVTAITNSGDGTYSGADGTGDTVDVTATTKGASGNSIATTETMTNGSFANTTLTGGVDATIGTQWQVYVDATYLYVCVAANDVTGQNWRRVSLGSAY